MIKKQKYSPLISLGFLLLAATCSAQENDLWPPHFEWEAFFSQNVIYSSDNAFMADSDDALSFDNWEAGLLFTSNLTDRLTFSGQLLGRKVSESSDEDFRVGYGFFSLPLYQGGRDTLGVRLGRIRSSYGLYNETRDMPHTRVGIIMPQSVYFDKTRNSFHSADGVELFAFHDFDDNRLSYQIFLSRPVADEDEARETMLPVTDLKGKHSILAKISYGSEYDGPRIAFTYYRPQYEFDIDPGLLQSSGEFYSESMVTSFEYNQYDWTFTAEYLRLKNKTIGVVPTGTFISAFFERPSYYETYYAQFVYRFNEQWDTYVRYDHAEERRIKDPHFYSYDSTLGVTYRPDNHWLIRAEGHYVEGTSSLMVRDNAPPATAYWNALLMQVAYKW